MARMLFIRIDPTASEAEWQLVENGQLVGPHGKGELSDARSVARGVPVVVLVPAEEIFLNNLMLPGKNRQKLRKAIPFAIEDQLIDDIDDLHYALGTHTRHGRYLVAAVEERMMSFWDKAMLNAGLRVETIIPDVTALPQLDDSWTVLLESNRGLVRTPVELFATDIASLPMMLENLCATREDSTPLRVNLYDCSQDGKGVLLQASNPQIEFQLMEAPQGIFEIFAKYYDPRTAVNLLQGEYNRQEGWRKQLKPWYAAASLLSVWLVWQLVLSIGTYIDLNRTSTQLTQEMRKVHKMAFAGAKAPAPGYERSDMEARLKKLRGGEGRSAGGLQEMLVRVAPILKAVPDTTIETVHYLNGTLNIDLTMKDTAQIDPLKEQLQSKTGWDVKSQASTEKGVTRVRLKITSNS